MPPKHYGNVKRTDVCLVNLARFLSNFGINTKLIFGIFAFKFIIKKLIFKIIFKL